MLFKCIISYFLFRCHMKYFKSSDKVASVIAAVAKLLKSDKLWPCGALFWKVPLSEGNLSPIERKWQTTLWCSFLSIPAFISQKKMCIVISGENNNHLKRTLQYIKKSQLNRPTHLECKSSFWSTKFFLLTA